MDQSFHFVYMFGLIKIVKYQALKKIQLLEDKLVFAFI